MSQKVGNMLTMRSLELRAPAFELSADAVAGFAPDCLRGSSYRRPRQHLGLGSHISASLGEVTIVGGLLGARAGVGAGAVAVRSVAHRLAPGGQALARIRAGLEGTAFDASNLEQRVHRFFLRELHSALQGIR